jgi:hypothetical protein
VRRRIYRRYDMLHPLGAAELCSSAWRGPLSMAGKCDLSGVDLAEGSFRT